jgi:predicted DNA-binding protein (MmcQ/YjbR family)
MTTEHVKQEQVILTAVRAICSSLPEVVEEVDGFGHTVFRVKDKSFVRIGGDTERGYSLSFKANRETQEFLIQQQPYWKTPYIGQHGWVSTWANEPDCWSELGPLLVEGYCLAAPKNLVKQVLGK